MQQSQTDHSILAHAALLYYGEGLTQSEVAVRMGVSRATIVGYLRQARERQIVDIRIDGEAFAQSDLARRLKTKFGLEDVYLAPGFAEDDAETATKRAASVAATALSYLLAPGDRLGVAWGETIQQLAFDFPVTPVKDLRVYQMIGAMRSRHLLSAESCSIEIARRTGAACQTLHVPALVSTVELAEALRREPQIKEQFDALKSLTKCVFSVGHLTSAESHVVDAGIARAEDLPGIRAMGGAGVVCGQFIDHEGQMLDLPTRNRILGSTPDAIRRIPFRMLVVGGEEKRSACLAALKGGLCTHLVLDQQLAEWLVMQVSTKAQ